MLQMSFAPICTSVRTTTDSKRALPIGINKLLQVGLRPVWILGVKAGAGSTFCADAQEY